MTCIICHGVEIVRMEVREEMPVGSDLVLVPIRVPVCQTCGERYYDRQTMRYLEKVEQELKEDRVDLEEIGRVLVYDRTL